MKTIVLGVGNPILGDDGVGLHILKEAKEKIKRPDITFSEAYTGGMNLLDLIMNHDRALLIDAVKMKDKKPGEIAFFDLKNMSSFHSHNPHDVTLPEAIKLARHLGDKRIPDDIKLLGINLDKTPTEFSEELSPEISKIIPKAVDMIKKEVESDD